MQDAMPGSMPQPSDTPIPGGDTTPMPAPAPQPQVGQPADMPGQGQPDPMATPDAPAEDGGAQA